MCFLFGNIQFIKAAFFFAFLRKLTVTLGKPSQSRMSSSIAVKIEQTGASVEGSNKSKSETPRSFRARTIAPHQLHGCLINRVELFYDTGCATIIIYLTPHRYPLCDGSLIHDFSPIINHA